MVHDCDVVWRISGGSGDGIDSTSTNLARALMRSGLHVFSHRHYPSRIRGGHTYVELRAAEEPVQSRGDGYNVLLALGDSFARSEAENAYYGNEEVKPLAENLDGLRDGGLIVYDSAVIDTDDIDGFDEQVEDHGWDVHGVDLSAIAKEHGAAVMRNTAGVGIIAELLGFDVSYVEDILDEEMSGDVYEANQAVLDSAVESAADIEASHEIEMPTGEYNSEDPPALLTASQTIAFGSVDEGCRFIAGYPMTPWTGVFEELSKTLPQIGGIAEQVEDEIAAASLAIGASHAGVKAMSGSSGGGFALMSEPLGLAEITETPLVLVEAMRAGPSTGMPTKPEQGDLEHVLYTSQGDSCRVVLAPGNAEEAYDQTRQAFRIAYDYHIPVIVLYDQKLSGELRTVSSSVFDREPTDGDLGEVLDDDELADAPHHPDGKFSRYRYDGEGGVSPRSLPGQEGGHFLATGNEHNEQGHISEDPKNRAKQMSRRLSKLGSIREELDAESNQSWFGDEEADVGLITFGSQRGTVAEATRNLCESGHSVRALSVSDLMPFPTAEVQAFLDDIDECYVVEMNATAQFANHLRREVDVSGVEFEEMLRFDGEPFTPGNIEAAITGDEV